MSLLKIMNENEIQVDWIFTHGRLHGREGLVFFEVKIETEEIDGIDQEYQTLEPKCILIDGARFNYSTTMDNELEINIKDDKVIFNKIDGSEISIPINEFENMPFKLVEFGPKPIKQNAPDGYVKVE